MKTIDKQYWKDLAEVIDALRLLPRFFLIAFGAVALYVLIQAIAVGDKTDYIGNGLAAITVMAWTKAYDYYVRTGGSPL